MMNIFQFTHYFKSFILNIIIIYNRIVIYFKKIIYNIKILIYYRSINYLSIIKYCIEKIDNKVVIILLLDHSATCFILNTITKRSMEHAYNVLLRGLSIYRYIVHNDHLVA